MCCSLRYIRTLGLEEGRVADRICIVRGARGLELRLSCSGDPRELRQ